MKIKVVKKATKSAKPQGYCPIFVDDDGFKGAKK
jgi:hypothetical protein